MAINHGRLTLIIQYQTQQLRHETNQISFVDIRRFFNEKAIFIYAAMFDCADCINSTGKEFY